MTNEHTPAPWRVIGSAVRAERGDEIAYVQRTTFFNSDDLMEAPHVDHKQAQANARLIAAAPELLEALEYIVTGVVSPEGRRRAEAAIAKATVSQDAARATGER